MPTASTCDRCGQIITAPGTAMRITGEPLGPTGPKLLPTTLCSPDCTGQLARWLAAPTTASTTSYDLAR